MCKRVALFLLIALFFATSAGGAGKFTLVIDAGHGGHDAGAVGAVSKEKDLTLKFALAFGRLVERNCPDVKVVYTRKTDTFVGLMQRAEIANKNKADLFISVHINALPKGRVARGFQTYTLGVSRRTGSNKGYIENLEVAKRENDVIYLEKDYQQTYKGFDPNSLESIIMYEIVQDKNMSNSVELAKYMQTEVCRATGRADLGAQQDNLAVLRLSSMPGCLIELGFISTPDEERFMASNNATDRYARGIYNAFLTYYKKHGNGGKIAYMEDAGASEQSDKKPEQPKAKPAQTNAKPEKPVSKPEQQQEVKQKPSETKPKVSESKPKVAEAKPKSPENQPQPTEEALQPTEEIASQQVAEQKPAEQDTISVEVSVIELIEPVFKVQILASTVLLEDGHVQFKGLKEVGSYQEGGYYKYTVGASTDHAEVSRLCKEIKEKFPEAFVVAFKGEQKVNLAEAIQEFRSNQKKKQ
ncbi:MAG: N-acetylmuramoyl-L-alanine amidase [Prevotella sp.]|nr:N-acetylmuramoyl-L-alanine amidase [Prevotella sp.]